MQVNPRLKALSEGRLAGIAFLNQGGDLLADSGFNALANSALADGRFITFAAMSGGSSRYNSGSHVDVDGFSLMTGLGKRLAAAGGNVLLGAFFEAGWGSYDSYNSFSNYYGGGLLGRYLFANGFYAEASGRLGRVSTDFFTRDLYNALNNQYAGYDSGVTYYGAHAGLGYLWEVTEKTTIDFSSKYFWTRQGGDSLTVAGDPLSFSAVNSQRWRSDARVSYAATPCFSPYAGAAHEYEFSGKARAAVYGYEITSPSLGGHTGVGELGFVYRPAAGHGFSADLGVQGYVGKREGVSGSLKLQYEF